MNKYLFLPLLLCLFASDAGTQQVYKWKDEKGQWRFSQTPPPNTQGVEQRSMPQSLPYEMPKDEPCSVFKVGEVRKPKAVRPSFDVPYLQIKEFELRLLEASKGYSKFSWRITVQNTAPQRERVQGIVTLLNCEMFPIVTDKSDLIAIGGGEEQIINGSKIISGESSNKVGRFNVSLGRVEPATAQQPPAKAPSYLKPRVSVIATNLYRANDSGIYFSGEVYNAGSAVARNVKVSFTIKNESGIAIEHGIVPVEPSDLKPGGSAIFQKRVFMLSSPSGYSWFSEAEWSE